MHIIAILAVIVGGTRSGSTTVPYEYKQGPFSVIIDIPLLVGSDWEFHKISELTPTGAMKFIILHIETDMQFSVSTMAYRDRSDAYLEVLFELVDEYDFSDFPNVIGSSITRFACSPKGYHDGPLCIEELHMLEEGTEIPVDSFSDELGYPSTMYLVSEAQVSEVPLRVSVRVDFLLENRRAMMIHE